MSKHIVNANWKLWNLKTNEAEKNNASRKEDRAGSQRKFQLLSLKKFWEKHKEERTGKLHNERRYEIWERNQNL